MKILVAGIPRSGTMLVWNSLDESERAKTHLFPDVELSIEGKRIDKTYKVIFLFSDPLLSVMSTYRMCNEINSWISKHAQHCGCYKEMDKIDIINRDDFNYEKMFDEWTTTDEFEVLCLRYETLYENINILEEFIGRKLDLPPWKKRQTTYNNVSPELFGKIQKTYAGLVKKVHDFPDFKWKCYGIDRINC